MERETRKYKEFMSYEYKEVTVDIGQASFLMDGYANFGWEADENVMPTNLDTSLRKRGASQYGKITIRLKRDRRIINKTELTRLQRNFEAYVTEIEHLEKEKTSFPTIRAITMGIVGTAFMAGSHLQ